MAGATPIVLGTRGIAVTFCPNGAPVTVAANGQGIPVVEKPSGGIPVTLVPLPPP